MPCNTSLVERSGARPIPFLDLIGPHQQLHDQLVQVFERALDSAGFIGGPIVDEFEREFADFCASPFSIGVGSGTDALRFALIAAGVQPGETVITVPNTFIATTEAISQAGARPDFVDVDAHTYTMDPEQLRRYLRRTCVLGPDRRCAVHKRTGSRIAAVVPVHLYGQMADMDPILEVAEEFGLQVIEDACQAHGAEYFSEKQQRTFKAGTMGVAAAFSFYPGKNLGACGEAGAITTKSDMIAHRCRMLRDHGQSSKYYHDIEGYNGRLDAIQAGILRVKLTHLVEWNAQRRAAARAYRALLSGIDALALPHVPHWSYPVYHLYVVRVVDRAGLQKDLAGAGISTGIHYPIPLHLCRAYESLGFRAGYFPVAERAASQVLSLPMYPGLAYEDQRRIADVIRASLSTPRREAVM